MESFEELGLSPDVAAALAAEGAEAPTRLQEAVVPVVLRGNNIVAVGGPGSGTMIGWAAPLLQRLEPGGGSPKCVVAVPTGEIAEALAESLGRLAQHTGHTVSVLVGPWALPERCDVLFGTTGQLRTASHDGRLDLSSIEVFVVERAQDIESLGHIASLDGIMEQLDSGAQRVLVTLPQPDGVKDLVRARMARAVHAPTPAPPAQTSEGDPVRRGEVRFFTVPSSRERWTLEAVARLLEEDASHVVVYCRSEDRIADVGDYLTLHGFVAGAPGDDTVPVWLASSGLDARAAAEGHPDPQAIATVSCDAPMDADALDRRHGWGGLATVVVLPREMAHLRAMGREAGYKLSPVSLSVVAVPKDVATLRDALKNSAEEGNLGAEMLVLEPLLEEFSAAELAAAALQMLRESSKTAAPGAGARAAETDASGARPFVRLFVSAGHKDELSPRELLGALAGESGVKGDYFGRLDIRDTFSLVEVHPDVADKVIKGANGLTIKGRATRVDYDRGARKPGGGAGGGPRSSGGRPAPRREQPPRGRTNRD